MKKVIVLSGIPGCGKTWSRENSPELSALPFIDIADIYRIHEEKFPGYEPLDWCTATLKLLRLVREILPQKNVVVVEGCFLEGSPSRKLLQEDARVGGHTLEFVDIVADPEVCRQRIQAQYAAGEIDWPTANTRLRVLGSIIGGE